MNIFVVETCMVKPEKREQFKYLMQRVLKYKEKNPELFKEVKSWKLFKQMFGGMAGAYVSMWEFENLADLEKCWAKEEKDEGFMKMHQELLQLIEPATFSMKIWASAM
ncbi:MAG: hypothetical protein OEZ35_05685 [Candidatus Bathyarchaeota archaeon]|nr:hypothetical protein [Candidatus Bathyarchaeota archaeon]